MAHRAIGLLMAFILSSPAYAGAIIELVLDDPGPYYGGESLTVDVWVNSNESVDLGLRGIQFDFSDSDPALSFDSTFTFDFSSIPSDINAYVTFADTPLPRTFMMLDCFCPELLIQLPVDEPLHVGSVGVVLPADPGEYRVDILNAVEGDPSLGAWMRLGFTTGPEGLWRAHTRDIVGGTIDFVVVPEPTMLSFLALGGLAMVRRKVPRRLKKRRRDKFARLIVIAGVLGIGSVAQAGAIVELVPDDPGPYYGGESFTVDVWLHSDHPYDVRLRRIQLDFWDSSPGLSLDDTLDFDFSSLADPSGYQFLFPELPVPWTANLLDCFCPHLYLLLPGEGRLHVGALGVDLPAEAGRYVLDALNANDPDASRGATLNLVYSGPEDLWRAHTGEIVGGSFDFAVVPGPSALALLLFGSVGLLSLSGRRRTSTSARAMIGSRRRTRSRAFPFVCCVGLGLAIVGESLGQPGVIPNERVDVAVGSGSVSTTVSGSEPVVVFSEVVSHAAATWIRLHFADVTLSGSRATGNESFLRITSLEDGAMQILDSFALARWQNTSAYFNGDAILLELLSYPNTGASVVIVDRMSAGIDEAVAQSESDCLDDDRVSVDDPRTGRFLFYDGVEERESGCTAFLFNDRPNCLLSAGHCCHPIDFEYEDFPPIVEFNVPSSDVNGAINHPGPQDQYPMDSLSAQFQDAGVGNDWCYFGVFHNTQTGLSPLEAQARSHQLAHEAAQSDNSVLRITGYGVDKYPAGPEPPFFYNEFSQTEQAATGIYETLDGTVMSHDVFTSGGTSGSPIEHVCRGLVYGIHTHGGCFAPYYANFGTAIHHPGLQAALANPQGVCAEPLDCNDNGIPDAQDIALGTSEDCTGNGVPDECEPDCNSNGVADSCDIAGGVPDENDNGVPDKCDVAVFVDQNATGANDGTSWDDAYTDLRDTLTFAPDTCQYPVRRIWVAGGTYKPDGGTSDRSASFAPAVDLEMYGGFAGGETSFDQRDPSTNVTILSGDIGIVGDDSDNSYHVVDARYGYLLVLDGFTTTGGNADGVTVDSVGGGMLPGSWGEVVNCILRDNAATNMGGAAYTEGVGASFVNCLFSGNTASLGGGMAATWGASPSLINCTFSGNHASSTGGGVYTSNAAAILRNSIIWGNSADGATGESAQIAWYGSQSDVGHSCIQDLGSLAGNDNIGADPLLVDPDGPDDIFGTEDDDLRLLPDSPCIDRGDDIAVPSSGTTDLDGNPRIVDADGQGPPNVDMGAYEYFVDCNANDVHDNFDPADWDDDSDVDLCDFACFQICFDSSDQTCLDGFDRAVPCQEIDPSDYAVLNSQFAGPGVEMLMGGGGGRGGSGMGSQEAAPSGNDDAGDLGDQGAVGGQDETGVSSEEIERPVDFHQVFADGFVWLLTTIVWCDGLTVIEIESLLEELTDWCVTHMTAEERRALAERLQDPSLTFPDPVNAEMVPRIITTLLQ